MGIYLMVCKPMNSGRYILAFRRNQLPLSPLLYSENGSTMLSRNIDIYIYKTTLCHNPEGCNLCVYFVLAFAV